MPLRSTAHWLFAFPAAFAVLAEPHAAHATAFELGGGVGADFNAGADTLSYLQFTDGDTQEIKAGNGLSIHVAGGAVFFDEYRHQLQTSLSLGAKFSTMQPADNADLSFTRFPIELLAFYRNDDWHFRAGGGPVLYAGSSLTGSGAASGIDLEFDTALGGIFQADFVYEAWFVGLRYTVLRYQVSGTDESFAANSLGVTLGYLYRFLE